MDSMRSSAVRTFSVQRDEAQQRRPVGRDSLHERRSPALSCAAGGSRRVGGVGRPPSQRWRPARFALIPPDNKGNALPEHFLLQLFPLQQDGGVISNNQEAQPRLRPLGVSREPDGGFRAQLLRREGKSAPGGRRSPDPDYRGITQSSKLKWRHLKNKKRGRSALSFREDSLCPTATPSCDLH
ncbi:hypothetical protein EYF80_060129 [Liparis tanakae]|uniref:Uncharacterized protein n=1 Tax=Liparis tanakae TaxID=230148 RepID=A0A4Z2EMW5_9TELE|nr:hypothetical protein EYF80_060129 [Liparis tanakae]